MATQLSQVQKPLVPIQQQEDPLLRAAREEAAAQVNDLFQGLDQPVATYAETANKCVALFKTDTSHGHAMEWLFFHAEMESLQEPWKTFSKDNMHGRVEKITILGHHRDVASKEMEKELPAVLSSLEATITELSTISKLSRDALLALRKCGYRDMATLKEKYGTILASKLHCQKLKTALTELGGQIHATYYALKGPLQSAVYPEYGQMTDLALMAMGKCPTVDRLRTALLKSKSDLFEKNPFHAAPSDHVPSEEKKEEQPKT